MKRCTYCGNQYPDELQVCPTDGKVLQPLETPPRFPAFSPVAELSPQERRFWERMTFRQFAFLLIRLQALWLVFGAVVNATYLPAYFRNFRWDLSYGPLYTRIGMDLFLALLRVIIHAAGAVALIIYAERILSWLVKDFVASESSPSAEPRTSPGT